MKLLDIKTEGKNPNKASGWFGLAPEELIWKEAARKHRAGAAWHKPEG